ncbi:MAG: TetR/AcrR family transcriptional regulator [Aestuariivirgaceae bacterium]|nr:TetR/AcrR family transcriptional regulator [Aestuariivirgaceae bacterium]
MTESTPPATVPRRRKQARPAEILLAGLEVFAEKGFAAARLEDVAARAGIVKGTIYRYFESKEALFEAAVKSRLPPIFANIDEMVDAFPGSSPDLLRLVITRLYQEIFGSQMQVLVRIILTEGGRHPGIAAFYHRESISLGRKMIARIVARGVARGEFRAGAAADLPIILMAPAIMAMIWKMTFDAFDPISTEAFMAAHLDLVLNGLAQQAET